MHFRYSALAAIVALTLGAASASAQRVATPEQRIDRLEKQVRQVQRQVFPRGEPADTAGFSDDPAATQTSVRSLDQRLATLERQLSDILRQSEENGHRAAQLEAELTRLRTDQDARLRTLEAGAAAAPVAATVDATGGPTPVASKPRTEPTVVASKPTVTIAPVTTEAPAEDPAEVAYDEGYQLWRSGKFDQAITSLRAFISAFPKHRRTSWANNLVGRALLDKGQPRPAAEALLANYRANPRGERAADSLYYLGQSLMKLGQPGQACKAYAELEAVYGAAMRGELKSLLPAAKVQANCS